MAAETTAPQRLQDVRMRDPYIIETADDGFVLFGTTDPNPWGGPATGFDCYTSDDLDTWLGPVPAFRPPTGFWSDSQYWAPEVHLVDGRYFMFATFAVASGSRPRGVAVLVADAATGPYVPWSDGPLTPPTQPCLDGTLYIAPDGVRWLVYSRGAEGSSAEDPGIADGEMYAMQLAGDLRRPAGEPVLLFRASAAPWARPLRFPDGVEPPPGLHLAQDPLFTDGPFLFRPEGGPLSMLWSSYGEAGYAMGVAVSPSGEVTGPWLQSDAPVWSRNGGHGMVLRTRHRGFYLVFHAPNDTPDERVRLVELPIEDGHISRADR